MKLKIFILFQPVKKNIYHSQNKVKYDKGANIEIKFLDSYKFLPSSLSESAKSIEICNFKILKKGLIKKGPKTTNEL